MPLNIPTIILLLAAAAASKPTRSPSSFIRAVNLPKEKLQQPACVRIFGWEKLLCGNRICGQRLERGKAGDMALRVVDEVDDIDVLRQDCLKPRR